MRLLFVVPYVPTPIRARPYNLLRYLARRNHDITLATVWENEAEREGLRVLEGMGIRVLAEPLGRTDRLVNIAQALVGGVPLQSRYSWRPALANRLSGDFDLAHVEHLRAGGYIEHLRRMRPGLPVLWDSVDCISHLFDQARKQSVSRASRGLAAFELGRTARYETRLLGLSHHVLVTSPVDQQALARRRAAEHENYPEIDVLANGVDLEYFSPVDQPRDHETIVFTGKLSYHANVSAVVSLIQDLMPAVWNARPGVKVWLVGKDPASRVRQVADQDPRVELFASVPDMRTYLRGASLAVAPMTYGAGIQNKVIEAMACGTPVLTTAQGSSAMAAGEHLRVASLDQFPTEIIKLIADPAAREHLGRQGRRFVEQQHDWAQIVQGLEEKYVEIISKAS